MIVELDGLICRGLERFLLFRKEVKFVVEKKLFNWSQTGTSFKTKI